MHKNVWSQNLKELSVREETMLQNTVSTVIYYRKRMVGLFPAFT